MTREEVKKTKAIIELILDKKDKYKDIAVYVDLSFYKGTSPSIIVSALGDASTVHRVEQEIREELSISRFMESVDKIIQEANDETPETAKLERIAKLEEELATLKGELSENNQ